MKYDYIKKVKLLVINLKFILRDNEKTINALNKTTPATLLNFIPLILSDNH